MSKQQTKNIKTVARVLGLVLGISILSSANAEFPQVNPGTTNWGNFATRYRACGGSSDPSCYNRYLYSYVAEKQTFQQNDPALPLLVDAANRMIQLKINQGRVDISGQEFKAMGTMLNKIMRNYQGLRDSSRTGGGAGVGSPYDLLNRAANMIPDPVDKEGAKLLLDIVKDVTAPGRMAENQAELDAQTNQLQQKAPFATYYSLVEQYPVLGKSLEPTVKAFLGFGTNNTAAIENGSVDLKNLHLSELEMDLLVELAKRGDSNHNKAMKALGQVNANLVGLKNLIENQMKKEELEKLKEAAEQARRASLQAQLDDYNAMLSIASSLGSLVTDPDLRRGINVSVGIGKVAMSIAECKLNPKNLSNIVLSANVIGAATQLLSMFMGGPSEMQQVMEQLQFIQKQIQELQSMVAEGFNQTFERLDKLFTLVNTGFTEVLKNQEIAQQTLNDIQSNIYSVQTSLLYFESGVDAKLSAIADRVVVNDTIYCLKGSDWLARWNLSGEDYNKCIVKTINQGSSFSKDAASTGMTPALIDQLSQKSESLFAAGSPFALESVPTYLSHKRVSDSFNFIAALAYLHMGASPFPINESRIQPLAEPQVWIAATRSVFDLESKRPRNGSKTSSEGYQELYAPSVVVRQAVREWRSKRFTEGVIQKLDEQSTQIVSAMQSLIDQFESNRGLKSLDITKATPQKTEARVSLPDEIQKNEIEKHPLEAKADIRLPKNFLPDWAEVGFQIGAFKMGIDYSYQGGEYKGGNIWEDLKFDRQGTTYSGRGHGRICGGDCGDGIATEYGKVSAHMHIKMSITANGEPVARCDWKTTSRLWVGDFRHTEGQERSYNTRTNEDVRKQIWKDGVYQLRDKVSCRAIQNNQAKLAPKIEEKWNELRKEGASIVVHSLSQDLKGEFNADSKALHSAMMRRSGFLALYSALMGLAYHEEISKQSDLYNVLFGGGFPWESDKYQSAFTKVAEAYGNIDQVKEMEKKDRALFETTVLKASEVWSKKDSIYPDWDALMTQLEARLEH